MKMNFFILNTVIHNKIREEVYKKSFTHGKKTKDIRKCKKYLDLLDREISTFLSRLIIPDHNEENEVFLLLLQILDDSDGWKRQFSYLKAVSCLKSIQ